MTYVIGKISFIFCKESVKSNRSYGTKFKHWLIIDIAKSTDIKITADDNVIDHMRKNFTHHSNCDDIINMKIGFQRMKEWAID